MYVLVDENVPAPKCIFPQGPDVTPVLDTTRSIQFCEGRIFRTIEAGMECVSDNLNAEDVSGGCRPIETNVTSSSNVDTCEFEVDVSLA